MRPSHQIQTPKLNINSTTTTTTTHYYSLFYSLLLTTTMLVEICGAHWWSFCGMGSEVEEFAWVVHACMWFCVHTDEVCASAYRCVGEPHPTNVDPYLQDAVFRMRFSAAILLRRAVVSFTILSAFSNNTSLASPLATAIALQTSVSIENSLCIALCAACI